VQSARAQGLPSLNASASYTREQLGLAGILKSQGLGSSGPTASGTAQQLIASSRHALAVLTGQNPDALDTEFGATGAMPAIPTNVPVGVPSMLARRRPDIRNAETALHAATAEIGVSVASMFPDVSLAGSYGLRNIGTRY
jgi:outer membrane protein TolC